MIGAIPTAVSQFQPPTRPVLVMTNPAMPRTRQSLTEDRRTPSDSCVAEVGVEHDPDIARGTSPVAEAAGSGGFVISKLSMTFIPPSKTVDQRPRPHPIRAKIGKVSSSQ
jgi:hypothetical protein